MSDSPLGAVVRFIHRANSSMDREELSDQQLLERFLTNRDETAFPELVKRHGRRVCGVCLRVLHQLQDAEDAFQATFLILAQKAHSVKKRDTVGGWLYRVAYRVAIRASSLLSQHKEKETSLESVPEPSSEDDPTWQEIKHLLDEELHRLPEKYQTALILCDLEGHTQKEASTLVGCSEGTLSSRLYRGRQLLARRLTRRGVGISLSVLATLLCSRQACARLSYSLLASTAEGTAKATLGSGLTSGLLTETAQSLAQGALQMMFRATLLKTVGVRTVVCLLGTGAFSGSSTFPPSSDEEIVADAKKPKKSNNNDPTKAPVAPARPPIPGIPPGAPFPARPQRGVNAMNKLVKSVNQAQKDWTDAIQRLIKATKKAKGVKDLKSLQKLARDVENARERLTNLSRQLETKLRKGAIDPFAPVAPIDPAAPSGIPGTPPKGAKDATSGG